MTIPEQPLDPPEDNSVKSNIVVKVRCIAIKEITCSNCTLEQAWDCPWEYAVNEIELMSMDEVLDVEDRS